MNTRKIVWVASLLAAFYAAGANATLQSFIQMRNGYFYDPAAAKAWVPHGIAYQTWNRPLGIWQTHDQIDYDLDEMKKMGANSIRVDFVWQHIEEAGDNQWDWANYDYLVQACEARDIRIFALIGYQWPPAWFPNDWYTMHPPEVDSLGIPHTTRWQSDIIGYETPQARAQYAEFFSAVCSRYKHSKAIVAWIIGNEYGYLGLWSGLLDGYDPNCEQAFRNWCQAKYGTISNVNTAWGSGYADFSDIAFVEQYRAYGVDGAQWADMVQWREDSIAGYTALGAKAAKAADTNHLISYSTVGMQWGEEDWRYHAEDRGKITAACAATNAPLDFFSVNNYPWSVLGHESQNGQWGVSYTKKVAGVPVLYTETGFSSSESMWPGMDEQRQGPLIRNSLWESLEAGAIGTHIFAWHDRPYITDREKGFGILYANRVIKPSFWVSRLAFNLMDSVNLHELLAGSKEPKPDIAFLWTAANDSQYNRYECEMQQIAGALERLGYEPYFMNLEDLAAGAYTNYKAVILPRNMRVDNAVPGHTNSVLNFLLTKVVPKGVHVMAGADLPGMQDFNGKPRADFEKENAALFGVDVGDVGGYEMPARRRNYVSSYWNLMEVDFTSNAVGAVSNAYHYWPYVWKYSDEIKVTNGGVVWATLNAFRNKGFEDSDRHLGAWAAWNTNNMAIRHSFPKEGTNMLQMWGDAGIYQDFPVVPYGRYTASAYLQSGTNDPLRGGQSARIQIEWYDETNIFIGVTESTLLTGATPNNSWVQYKVDTIAPENAWTARRIIRCGWTSDAPSLLLNGGLDGAAAIPTSWSGWNTNNFAVDTVVSHMTSPSRAFWWDSGIWQDVTSGFKSNDVLKFGGWLFQPTNDALQGGKRGTIEMELYNGGTRLSTWTAQPPIQSTSASGVWVYAEGTAAVPVNVTLARVVVRCNAAGSGRFNADDLFLKNTSPGGSVYVDGSTRSPALVVKNHSTAKSAIFLYSPGDMRPDATLDGNPDIYNWKWRYDVFGSVMRDCFGVQPQFQLVGTNACFAIAEYRTCTNGATLWQIKNYLYDTNFAGGGAPQTFTIQSALFTGKTVRALEQGRILATNCSGTVQVTLPPDGHEILYVYAATTNKPICQIADSPAVVHPFGDKNYKVQVSYDTLGKTNLTLKIALVGGKNGSQTLETASTNVSGTGTFDFWVWIPDFDASSTNYASSADGGQFKFVTWLEDSTSNRVSDLTQQATELLWGVRPMTNFPTTVAKGSTVNMPMEWEDLYEYLPWENTPMARNDAFPARVAVFRSSKTEAQYPGHFGRVNQVCDWLESMGYESGNDMDLSFDNVIVSLGKTNVGNPATVFSDASGTNGWSTEGLWHLATDLSYSPSLSWAYNNGSNYSTGTRTTGSIISPWISLSNATAASLSFRSWYQTEDAGTSWDRKLVYVSTDGTNWTQVFQITGPSAQWTAQGCDLSAYAGRRIKVKFTFDSVDAMYNQFRGWYVDDVTITTLSGTAQDLFYDTMESTTNWTPSGMWRRTGSRGGDDRGTNRWVYNQLPPNTNYNSGARNSGSLVSRWIDLTTAAGASLSFESWYRTEDTGTSWDRKTVLVSADGTNWTQVLQVSGPNQQWTAQTCDLGAYAGQRIKVRFFFDTIDSLNNSFEGWYVDNVRVSTLAGAGVPAFSDSVEEGTNGWQAAGLWHQASDLALSPVFSWAYNNGSNYNTGARNSAALLSPWIDLTEAASATMNFRSWYETEDTGTSWDRKTVSVSTDGTNWTQVLQVSGPNKQWTSQTIPLDMYAGRQIRLRFLFDTIDGVNNGARGWYIDNIVVNMTVSDVLFSDNFASGSLSQWTRAAGCANWCVTNGWARAWRIGNDDNIVYAGDANWSNYTAAVDFRYNKMGPYFNEAELYLRYVDRNNFVKVSLMNYYDFWRLKYTVRIATNNSQQAWVHEFMKTNSPVEGATCNLKVHAESNTFTVFFDGDEVSAFMPTNFPFLKGKIAIGTRAAQLGIWEPQKGYYFIDDDEYSYYAPEGQQATKGSPLNLDWGYLVKFFPTLILPSTYVMSDVEVSNVTTWLNLGLFSVIATDGGIAMKNEAGATDLGRIEGLFGVGPAIALVSNLTKVTVGTNDHYVTQDYASCAQVGATGGAVAWTTLAKGRALGAAGGSATTSVLIVNTLTNDPLSPKKVFCFNMGADTQGQLTNSLKNLAARAFEWARGEAHKVRVELKYTPIRGSLLNNITVASWEQWVLGGTGSNLLNLVLPGDGIMTGDNLFWVTYMYPWDAEDAWLAHDGFYTSSNDGSNGLYTSISGLGLQVLGVTETAFAGRDWDTWVAYNTRSTTVSVAYGIKDKGATQYEDNFSDGNYTGWNVVASPRIAWSVSNNALQAKVISVTTGDYGYIYWNGLAVTGKNITIEYATTFTNGARDGGVIYGGRVLYVNPNLCGWADDAPNYYVVNKPVTGKWHKVVVHIRDGSPYLMSDLFVDNKTVFLSEPIQVTSWTTNTVGFLSPYSNLNSVARWDNVRIADEQYSVTYTNFFGEKVPTNDAVPTLWASIPDYDPAMLEHEGTTLGGSYEWYTYFHGEGVHSYADAKVYFSPRLRVELATFPTNLTAGTNVVVPVEWENLPTNSAMLRLRLWDAYTGLIHLEKTSTISGATGATNVPVTIPTMPGGGNYVWTAFLYLSTAADPWTERIGSDDTFRFDDLGIGVEPETPVTFTPPPATGGTYNVYSDAGMPFGSTNLTWDSYRTWGVGTGEALFNGNYTNITPPEGSKCYYASTINGTTYGGWGVFRAGTDLKTYSNGYLKFWIRSSSTVKIDLEGPQGNKRTRSIATTTNTWQECSLPLSNFSGVVLTNMYGLFEATVEASWSTFYIDNVRWSLTP